MHGSCIRSGAARASFWPLPLRRQGEAGRGCPRFGLIRKAPLPNPPLPSQGRGQELAAEAAPTRAPGVSSGGSEQIATRHRTFQRQQELLGRQSAAEAGQRAVGADHTMAGNRSEEHTSELQSLMRSSYAVFCLQKKKQPLTP